jgi:hypothetical protein
MKRVNLYSAIIALLCSFSIAQTTSFASSEPFMPTPTIQETIEGTIIDRPEVSEIYGGINPDFFGYRVSGAIRTGSNHCLAEDAYAYLDSFQHGDTVYVIPVRIRPGTEPKSCSMVHQPVYELRSIELRHSRHDIKRIVVRNVGESREDLVIEP